jgi:hypothetical protein
VLKYYFWMPVINQALPLVVSVWMARCFESHDGMAATTLIRSGAHNMCDLPSRVM